MIVILADHEEVYVDILSKRLQTLLPDILVLACKTALALQVEIAKVACQDLLVIFNPVDFPGLDQQPACRQHRSASFWRLVSRPSASMQDPADSGHEAVYSRLGSVKCLADKIRSWQRRAHSANLPEPGPDLPEQIQIPTNGLFGHLARTAPESRMPPDSRSMLHLLICVRPEGYQPGISRARLRELVDSGRRTVYLPLMPTYQMSCLSPPGHGLSLSDLLLQLLGQNIRPDDLGVYWQPHPDGYLQFRPPDRSDDLPMCNPDLLRQLIILLRNRLKQDEPPGTALIDCAGMPFAAMAVVAVLCDTCECLLPDRDSFATDAARREIGLLLARLPSGCKIMERQWDCCGKQTIGKDDFHAPGSDHPPKADQSGPGSDQ